MNTEELFDLIPHKNKFFITEEELVNYIKDLQEENEFLKLNNPEMNIEHFRIVKENKRKIDNLRKENEKLLKKSYSDDVKITKAIELISKEFLCYDNESDEYTQGKKVINILNGGDEE